MRNDTKDKGEMIVCRLRGENGRGKKMLQVLLDKYTKIMVEIFVFFTEQVFSRGCHHCPYKSSPLLFTRIVAQNYQQKYQLISVLYIVRIVIQRLNRDAARNRNSVLYWYFFHVFFFLSLLFFLMNIKSQTVFLYYGITTKLLNRRFSIRLFPVLPSYYV